MRKILLLLLCVPVFCFGSTTLDMFHINDGVHKVIQSQVFDASEAVVSNDPESAKNISCTGYDNALLRQVNVNWSITINDFPWHYSIDSPQFATVMLVLPQVLIYKIEVKAVFDKAKYSGPFGYMKCDTTL